MKMNLKWFEVDSQEFAEIMGISPVDWAEVELPEDGGVDENGEPYGPSIESIRYRYKERSDGNEIRQGEVNDNDAMTHLFNLVF